MALGKVIGLASCCIVFGAYAASARPLGPAKPSEVVVVGAGGAGDPCAAGGGRGFLTPRNPSGGPDPFLIPAGQVLVVTQVSASLVDITETSPSNRVFRVGLPAGPTPPSPVAYFVVPLDASGFGGAAQEFSPGLVFTSGQTVCVWPAGGATFDASLVGYLTKDK